MDIFKCYSGFQVGAEGQVEAERPVKTREVRGAWPWGRGMQRRGLIQGVSEKQSRPCNLLAKALYGGGRCSCGLYRLAGKMKFSPRELDFSGLQSRNLILEVQEAGSKLFKHRRIMLTDLVT